MWWKPSTSNRELLERLESLERRFKTLLADVDEYFQLVRRAENRIKLKTSQQEAQGAANGGGVGPEIPPVSEGMPGARLSEHQRAVQQAILKRRAGIS